MKIMKYLALAFLAFSLLSCEDDKINYRQPGESVPIDIEREPGMNVVGRVTVDGRPRAGVVVSDGVNVVATNDKGEYQMQSLDRQHVFVSVPADCQVPVDGGFCKFYKTIDLSQDAAIQLNFDLASAPEKTDFTLLTLADVQIGTDTDISMLDDILANTGWKNYVASLTGNMIGISLGDICWNAPAHYSTYRNRIAQLGVPMLSVIGNHDHDKGGTGDITTDKNYRDAMGPTYYSLNIGDWHIVALDDVLYTSHSDYAATITDQQMAWLKEDLKYVDKSKSILIGLHIPTIRRNSSGHVTNNHELYDLVKDYHQVQILSGHLHNNQHYDIASNIRESSIGAVMGAWWNGMICNDGSPRGYALLNMSGSKVVNNKYYGCDTPEDYQIKIYLPAEATFRAGLCPVLLRLPPMRNLVYGMMKHCLSMCFIGIPIGQLMYRSMVALGLRFIRCAIFLTRVLYANLSIATLGNNVRHPSLKRIVTTCSYISLPIKTGGLLMCVLLMAMATITMHLLTMSSYSSKLVLQSPL